LLPFLFNGEDMEKEKVLKVGGIVGIVIGTICLYLTGASETSITSLVGVVFVAIGVVFSFFKKS
jgi:LPXTG-motif cell wall-anchored protein